MYRSSTRSCCLAKAYVILRCADYGFRQFPKRITWKHQLPEDAFLPKTREPSGCSSLGWNM